MSDEQTGLIAPNLATVYHTYFQGHAEAAGERPPRGEDEATSAEVTAIKEGTAKLPAGSTCIFDVEPAPHGVPRTLYWPTWYFEYFEGESSVPLHSGSLSNENHAIPGFVGIQSPDRPEGVWQMSSGYRLICHFDPIPAKGRIVVWAGFGDNLSDKTTIPWVEHS